MLLNGNRFGKEHRDLISEFWLRVCSHGRVEALLPRGEHFENRRFFMWRRMERMASSLGRRGLAGVVDGPGISEDVPFEELQEDLRKGLNCIEAVDARDTAERVGVVALHTFLSAERSAKFARVTALMASGMSQREACNMEGIPEATFREMRTALKSRPVMRFIESSWFCSGNDPRRPAA